MQKTTITIEGTHCNSCKVLLEDVLSDIKGVKSSSVDFKTGKTEVEHEETLDWDTVKQAVASLSDYKVVGVNP